MNRWVALFLWATILVGGASAEPQCSSTLYGTFRAYHPLPIDLKCPSDNSGTLEVTSVGCEPGVKDRYRLRITYENNVSTVVWTGHSENDESFKPEKTIDLRTEKVEKELRYANILVKQSDRLLRDVCRGSAEDKSRYFKTLKENRAKFGSWIKAID